VSPQAYHDLLIVGAGPAGIAAAVEAAACVHIGGSPFGPSIGKDLDEVYRFRFGTRIRRKNDTYVIVSTDLSTGR
jgi:hypothetical protein